MTFETKKPTWFRCLLRVLLICFLSMVIIVSAIWATLAINYSNLPWSWARQALAAVFAIGTIAIFMLVRPWRKAVASYAALFVPVLIWYYLIPASNDRDWQPDVARLSTIDIQGDQLTVHNVRNFHYRSETDFDVRYEDRTYDRSKLIHADLVMSYWASPAICHTFVTFVFSDGKYLCVSIETRKEKGEGYSAVRGLFRQFELIYIFADERDLIGLRTDHRREDVYLYRLRLDQRRLREIFDDYIKTANDMAVHPRWYNAITDSCSIGIIYHARTSPGHRRFHIRSLVNGYWDEYLYADGGIFNELPFDRVRSMSRISERSRTIDPNANFSETIRAGLPGL